MAAVIVEEPPARALPETAQRLDEKAGPRPKRVGLNLFWRTFFLLAVLLIGSIMAWLHTLLSLEYEPRALHTAQQIASLVNLSRAALIHADAIARVSLIKTMADQEGVRILPREPGDRYEPMVADRFGGRMTDELVERLGQGTVVAQSVNGEKGLWVGFVINGDSNWLLLDQARFSPSSGTIWLVWLVTAAVLSLAGAAAITRLINRPLKQLSRAANRVREGDFTTPELDEQALTTEIREVNLGFNRMARRLAELEQDRAVMLAGISHDLRTPLARLRLETEMSVADDDARDHMVADMAQLDAIIDKFLDYARPDHVDLKPLLLSDVVASCVYAVEDHDELKIQVDIPEGVCLMADGTELARVVSNLIENARRYGKSPGQDVAEVDIGAHAGGREPFNAREPGTVVITVRDHGLGVPAESLVHLTKPFFRGDTARTSATGAGLGLSIVDKTVRRMGGKFQVSNARTGGFLARIELTRAPSLQVREPAAAAQPGQEKRSWRPSVVARRVLPRTAPAKRDLPK